MTSHSKGREGVHTSVMIRDEGDVGVLSVVTSCRKLCDSQNVICWSVAGVCCLWWSLLGWLYSAGWLQCWLVELMH